MSLTLNILVAVSLGYVAILFAVAFGAERRAEAGLEKLSTIQFANVAVVEKIRRELPEDVRLRLHEARGDKKYYLSGGTDD